MTRSRSNRSARSGRRASAGPCSCLPLVLRPHRRPASNRPRERDAMTLDQAALDHLLELTGGDAAVVDELIDTFIDDAADQLATLRAGAGTGDQERLLRGALSLKASAGNLG